VLIAIYVYFNMIYNFSNFQCQCKKCTGNIDFQYICNIPTHVLYIPILKFQIVIKDVTNTNNYIYYSKYLPTCRLIIICIFIYEDMI